ncbi:hypothetical protein [Lacinutrix undariae]
MKKITVLFLLISFSSFGQDLNFLDSNNGYKEFKFGKSPEEISEIKKVNWNEKDNKQSNSLWYEYVGNDITTFFNSDIRGLNLHFFKKKLFLINISLGELTEDFSLKEFEELKNQLSAIFGNDFYNMKKEQDIVDGYIWLGEKVKLQLSLYYYTIPNSEKKLRYCDVMIFHNSLNLEEKKSQF